MRLKVSYTVRTGESAQPTHYLTARWQLLATCTTDSLDPRGTIAA